jgi:hypothetical protein
VFGSQPPIDPMRFGYQSDPKDPLFFLLHHMQQFFEEEYPLITDPILLAAPICELATMTATENASAG